MLDLSRQMSSLLSDIFEVIRGLRKDLSRSLKKLLEFTESR
jgi:hypothetical protein